MASKKTKFDTPNFDIDAGLDIPDFDFLGQEVADDRSPTTKVLTGALEGAKDSVLNPSIIRSTIKRSLPDAYGDALDLADQGADSVRSLYNKAAKELKPAIQDLKRITRNTLPNVEGALPKKLAEILRNFSQEEKKYDLGKDQQRADSLAMELGEIFKTQAEDAAKMRQNDQQESMLKEGVDQKRFQSNQDQLDQIRLNTARVAQYQDNVLANYHKKSLELQFRQYYATVDILEATRLTSETTKSQLAGILKNTGLPEFVKINESERFQEIARNRFMEDLREGLFGGDKNFISKFIKNIGNNVRGKISDFTQGFGDLVGSVAMGQDMASSIDGVDKHELGGNIAGGLAADFGIEKGQDWLKKKLANNPAVVKGAEQLRYRMDNSGNLLRNYLTDYDTDWGPANGLKDLLAESLPGLKPQTKINVDDVRAMHEPAPAGITNGAIKSIVEIIPGLLSRIHQELRITRTGKNEGLLTYDYGMNKFRTEREVGGSIRDKIVNASDKEMVGERLDDLVKFVDPENKFSKEQKEAFRKEILRISLNRGDTDSDSVTQSYRWKGAGSGARGIADQFKTLFDVDEDGKRGSSLEAIRNQRIFTQKVKGLTNYMGDPRQEIQMLAALGQLGALKESGLLTEDGSALDLNKIADEILNTGTQPPVHSLVEDTNAAASQHRRRRSVARPEPRLTPIIQQPATPPGPGFDPAPLVKAVGETTEAVKAANVSDMIKSMMDSQLRIEKNIADGVKVFSLYAGEYDGPRMEGQPTEGKKRKKSIGEMTLGDLFSGAVSGAKGLASAGIEHAKKLQGLGLGVLKQGLDIGGKGLDFLREKVGGKVTEVFGDLYIKGEIEPRLTWAKMQAGEYRDAVTGKVITSFKDIRGKVVDKDGNLILSVEDIKQAFINSKPVQLLKNVIKGGTSLFTQLTKGLGGKISAAAGGIYGIGLGVAKKVMELAPKWLPPYDVYVVGNNEPSLFATQFKLGKYFSKKTGDVINHPMEIDGPVVDGDGNIILSDDELNKGIVDAKGIPVSSRITRAVTNVTQKLSAVAKKAWGALSKVGGKIKDVVMNIGAAFSDFFGGIFGIRGEFLEATKSQLQVQLEILELLKERLPEAKKKVVGDLTGDGVREGSYEDLKAKAAQKVTDAASVKGNEEGKAGGKGGILATLAGMLKGKRGKDKDEEEEEDDGSLLSDAADVADIYDAANGDGGEKKGKRGKGKKGKGIKGKGKGGRLAKIGRGLKGFGWGTAAKVAGKGLGLAGAAYGAYSAFDNLGKGNYGEAALDAGLAVGGAALTVGGLSALTATAMGIGGILASPVALVALGLTGAYFGYKYLTRATLTPINKYRYAQYGFPGTDEQHYKAIFELEDKLFKHVKLNGGTPSIDESKVDMKSLMEPFGVDPSKRSQASGWIGWFSQRFKPIYLAYCSALATVKPDSKPTDADGLPAEQKKKFLLAMELPNGPYDVRYSPFTDLNRLDVTATGVQAAFEIAKTEVDKAGGSKAAAAGAAGAAAALTAASSPNAANGNPEKGPGAAGAAVAGATAAAAGTAVSQDLNKFLTDADVVTNKPSDVRVSGQGNVPSDYLFTGQPGRLDALTSVRMKAYGLVEMELDKVRAIRMVENFVEKTLTFTNDGAVYNQDVEALLERVKVPFGITGARSPAGSKWMKWFKVRFLPVYLNYATSIEKLTKKKDFGQAEVSLKPDQSLTVGNAIFTTSTIMEGSKVPVWQVPYSPFQDYAVNMDEESAKPNIEFLTQAVKAQILGEAKNPAVKKRAADDLAAAMKDGRAPNPLSIKEGEGGAAFGYRKDPTTLRKERERMVAIGTNQVPTPLNPDGTNTRAIGDFIKGEPIKHPGKGTGGDITQIPDAKGAGWNNVRETLLAVAKMAGVDPKVLATMTAIESGFDPNAQPPIDPRTGKRASSATGLMQFINKTWNGQMKNYANKYGIAPGTPPTDARANLLMGAEFIKDNINILKKYLKRPITTTDAYMAHFLGPDTAGKFLSTDPNAIAAQILPDAANANKSIFYDLRGGGRPRTVGEVYKLMNDKVLNATKKFKISDSEFGQSEQSSAKEAGQSSPSTGVTSTAPTPTQSDSATKKPGTDAKAPAPAPAPAGTKPGPSGGYGASVAVAAAAPAAPATPVQQASQALNRATTEPTKTSATAPEAPKPAAPLSQAERRQAVSQAPATAPQPRPGVIPNFSGFDPRPMPSPREVKMQAEAQSAGMTQAVETISSILERQFKVQEESRDYLKTISERMSMSEGKAPDAKPPTPPKTSPAPTAAPRAPVSMKN